MSVPDLPFVGQKHWGTPLNAGIEARTSSAYLADKLAEDGPFRSSLMSTIGAEVEQAVQDIEAGGPTGQKVSPPAGFPGFTPAVPLPTVYRLGGGRFATDLDVDALRPPAGVTYYVHPDANASGDGLTPETPTTLPTAFAKPDVGTIVYAPGEYFRNTQATAPTDKSINHLAAGPGVKVTGWNNPGSTTWTLHTGSIYKTSRSGTTGIVDVTNRTEWGDYTVYEKVADAAAITKAGQWAIVGADVYAWPIGDTDLTVIANRYQLRLQIGGTTTGIYAQGSSTHYVRGIDFEGNVIGGLAVNADALIVAEDCTVKYREGDGVMVTGGRGLIMVRCEVSSNGNDGLSYSHNAGTRPVCIEVDVHSHHNGHDPASTTNNASTAHMDAVVVRVGGDYHHTGGPVVADVNQALSWNLGCRSASSTTSAHQQAHSWRADGDNTANGVQMWLDECVAEDNQHAYKVTNGGQIHVHASKARTLAVSDVTSGVVDYYTP